MGRKRKAERSRPAEWTAEDQAGMLTWRQTHGLSQERAARYLRTAGNAWARWERGHTWPTQTWREAIRELLAGPPAAVFPRVLPRWRKAHALTQTDAAALVDVTQQTWSLWEAGLRSPGRHEGVLWRVLAKLDSEADFKELPRPRRGLPAALEGRTLVL